MNIRRFCTITLPALLIIPLNGCLLELLSVTAIEGELHAKDAQASMRALDKAKTMSSSTSLQQAVNVYAAEKGFYPPNLQALVPAYIQAIPKRSDGTAYSYDPLTGVVGGAPGAAMPAASGVTPQDRQTMEQIRNAINRYGQAAGYYPPTLQALVQFGYLPQLPKTTSGQDFYYQPMNGALSHPEEFAAAAAASAPDRAQVPTGAGGGGLMGEAVAGIGVQNQLNNMSNAGVSSANSNARRGVDGSTEDYNQRQQQALQEFLP